MPCVVVPWLPGCPHRERAWEQIKPRYDWPVVEGLSSEPWCKALAVMPAIERCEEEIVVVADADVWTDGIAEAVQAVEEGAPWAIPHQLVHRLTEDGLPEQRPYPGIEGGGILAARRETLLEIPLDPRFVGWGQEDQSWAVALTTLTGKPWRGTADLYHHFHPPQPRLTRTRGSVESWNLRQRYMQARHDPEQMRALVQEARDALGTTAHPAGDADPAVA